MNKYSAEDMERIENAEDLLIQAMMQIEEVSGMEDVMAGIQAMGKCLSRRVLEAYHN